MSIPVRASNALVALGLVAGATALAVTVPAAVAAPRIHAAVDPSPTPADAAKEGELVRQETFAEVTGESPVVPHDVESASPEALVPEPEVEPADDFPDLPDGPFREETFAEVTGEALVVPHVIEEAPTTPDSSVR
ncbi:hypothetical protein [Streptomyces sp. NBC_01304]|uniref:hypothetical protein n=1 Tax=Streptomyces sp. NBC_01304 TaxID=2903818 RepID=UPI002E12FC9A|nr:hypothetical protein OG430_42395 [Streptomyces sp. NBC_01304]